MAVLTFSFPFQNHTFYMCSSKNILFLVLRTQYYTSTITDQIRQDGWAFVRILTLLAGLCPMGPCLVGFCYNQLAGIPQILIRISRRVPNCALFSVACAPSSVHITPIVMSAPLGAAKARIPRKCMPLSQRHYLPPLLLISLTSYSCTLPLDHSTPVPTPASRNSHSADAR